MKFDSLFSNKTYISIMSILILISGFSCSDININNQKSQTVDSIQSQLDDLINKLEKNNIKIVHPLSKDSIQNGVEMNYKHDMKGLDFSDEVIEAFQSLNHDFLEYENILSSNLYPINKKISSDKDINNSDNQISKFQEEKVTLKNLYQQNEENYKKLCHLHNENHYNNAENANKNQTNNNSFTRKYYEEIESLTSDISNSFDTFDKLEKVDENKKIVKEKITMIQEMKETISRMKEKIDSIKNNNKVLSEKRQNIKNLSEKIVSLYNNYLNLEKTINLKAKGDLEKIKKILAESHKSDNSIQKYFNAYDEILKFFNKINLQKNYLIEQSKFEEIKDKFETFGKFVTKINNSDKLSSEIR